MTVYELALCPVCKTNDFRQLVDQNGIKQEIEKLWEFHTRRLKPGAPVQQLFDRAIFSQAPPINVVECRGCGTVIRNPRESAEAIAHVYEDEKPPAEAFAALFDEQRAFYAPRVRTLTRVLGHPGDVLEVGSYVGGFLAAASERGWSAHGLDVSETANEFARARGCNVEKTTIEEFKARRTYDVVAFWNCFDQLADPGRALACALAMLRPGGIVVIRVPNGAAYSIVHRLRLPRALLAYNNLLGFPYRHGFTPASLKQLLKNAKIEVIHVHGDTLVSTASAWTRPWAAAADGAVKHAMRLLLPGKYAPWIEVYARAP